MRDKLLDIATGLFSAKGFAGVQFAEIATVAGVDGNLLIELFATEEQLYGLVLEIQFGLYRSLMQDSLQGNDVPTRKIELMAHAICDLHRQSPHFFPLYYRELLNPSKFFDPIVKNTIRHVAFLADNNIAKGIQKNAFKHGINPAYATAFLMGMFHYNFLATPLAETMLPDAGVYENYRDQALKIFLTGLNQV
jgi:AcrR family transcriptional regulator